MDIPDPSEPLGRLKNRLDLSTIPFTERGSRLLAFRDDKGFCIRLAERWPQRDGKAAVSTRPEVVTGLRLTDEAGAALPMTLTTYPHAVFGETPAGQVSLTFLDERTLSLGLPAGQCNLTFIAPLEHAHKDERGGVLELAGEVAYHLTYTTNADILEHTLEGGAVRLKLEASAGQALTLHLAEQPAAERHVPDAETGLEAAKRRWRTRFNAVPAVSERYLEPYHFAWWTMLAGLLSPRGHLTREAMSPSKTGMVGVWHWDAFFHALAYRHFDTKLAQDQLRVLLDHQHENGFIPDSLHDWEVITKSTFSNEPMTKPPLFAWAVWKLFEYDRDAAFLDEVYEPLCRWNDWWFTYNDRDGNGLPEYHHPYSSGLDNSPLWDAGLPVESPDLSSYLILHMDALARIAEVLGKPDEAAAWAAKAEALTRRLVELRWDAGLKRFHAVGPNGEPLGVRTLFNLFPLITGRLPEDITHDLVEQLTDPSSFWAPFPAATVALDDPAFDPKDMWRGPTWMPTNYLLVDGLLRCGFPELARELRRRSLELLARHPDFYEYYDPLTGEAPPKAYPFMGWSAALLIEFVLQEEM